MSALRPTYKAKFPGKTAFEINSVLRKLYNEAKTDSTHEHNALYISCVRLQKEETAKMKAQRGKKKATRKAIEEDDDGDDVFQGELEDRFERPNKIRTRATSSTSSISTQELLDLLKSKKK